MISALTLLAPFRGRSPTRGTGDTDRRSTGDVPPGGNGERRNGDRESGPGRSRLLPGFVPGGWKRNVVVGLTYLLGALALLGVVRFLIELF
jgi:hypothetical protein